MIILNIILGIIIFILGSSFGCIFGVYVVSKGIVIDMLNENDFNNLYKTVNKIKKQRKWK